MKGENTRFLVFIGISTWVLPSFSISINWNKLKTVYISLKQAVNGKYVIKVFDCINADGNTVFSFNC